MPPGIGQNGTHKTPLGGLLLGWVGVSVTVSLAIAFSGLEDAAQLPWAVQAMMGLVKSIEPWSMASPNPRHTAIFFATMWAISPAVLVLVFKERDLYFPPPDWPGNSEIATTLMSIALAAALVAFMIFGYGNDPTYWGDLDSRRSLRKFVLGSRLHSGAFGSLLVFFTAYTVSAAVVLLYRTFSRCGRTLRL
jgi:hypothetical protein